MSDSDNETGESTPQQDAKPNHDDEKPARTGDYEQRGGGQDIETKENPRRD